MKHIYTISRKPESANGIGIGQYLLVAGQILGILALMLVDKPTPEETAESR